MPRIAILGANGQLGQSLEAEILKTSQKGQWDFFSSSQIDIRCKDQVSSLFTSDAKYDYILNFAAYTKVDEAEKERELATQINALALDFLTDVCQKNQIPLIHLSTDYVFNGRSQQPYKETDHPHPINHYGQSKLEGENIIRKKLDCHFILRTGWLYSDYGHNFYRTMKKLAADRKEIRVVSDQIGTPTHTSTVVEAILKIISSGSKAYGTYHIGDQGTASWYEFARLILNAVSYPGRLLAISTDAYPTPALRPMYAVLDKSKFNKTFGHTFPNWEESFKKTAGSTD